MQQQTGNLNLQKQGEPPQYDGEYVAKIFKWYRRQQNPYVKKELPLKLVSGKALYKSHKSSFDKFASNASKNKFDVERYIKYCVRCGITESTVEACISSTTMIDKYMLHIKQYNKRKKIYKWFIKSARNVAKMAIDNGCQSTKDYLKLLFDKKLIGNYVISGQISIYYFAAIPNFEKIIKKLDYFSRKELWQLEEHFEIFHSEVNKAFLQEKNCKVNPVALTDKLIWKMQNN